MSIATGRHATVSVEIGGQEITFETGKLAKQADGAVVVRSGDTMILATAVGRQEARPDADFFPLTVDVEERMYAAGKIPGGFFKREGRATERATLTARMIDRPIRPLWPKGFRNEVQVICTVLSADMVHPHDILCINGASAALAISPLPFLGPVGAVRIGRIDGALVVNPNLIQQDEESDLDLIVVGTRDGLTMIEAGADQVPEDDAARGIRPRARRDPAHLRRDRGSARPGRQAEMGRSRAQRRARGGARRGDLAPDSGARAARGGLDRRRARPGVLPRHHHGLDRGGHGQGGTGQGGPRQHPREAATRRRGGPGTRAVRGRAARPHGRRAGLEGAEVAQARHPLRSHPRRGAAAVPGRLAVRERGSGEGRRSRGKS